MTRVPTGRGTWVGPNGRPEGQMLQKHPHTLACALPILLQITYVYYVIYYNIYTLHYYIYYTLVGFRNFKSHGELARPVGVQRPVPAAKPWYMHAAHAHGKTL